MNYCIYIRKLSNVEYLARAMTDINSLKFTPKKLRTLHNRCFAISRLTTVAELVRCLILELNFVAVEAVPIWSLD